MMMSETIASLAAALIQFQGEVSTIAYDKRNPQYRSQYVTLDTLIEVTKPVLQKHGLTVLQFPQSECDGVGVKTLLLHSSGEFIESDTLSMIPVRMVKGGEYLNALDPQAAGSTISYLRRYSYLAILNLATGEDDDCERGCGRGDKEEIKSNTFDETTETPKEEPTPRTSRRERTTTSEQPKEESKEETPTRGKRRRSE